MMKKILIGTAMAAVVGMTGCASTASTPTTYADYVDAATATHAKAAAHKNVWKQKKMKLPYVEHYLAKADEAKKKGDEAAAMKFAKEAYKSANAEMMQVDSWNGLKPAWEK